MDTSKIFGQARHKTKTQEDWLAEQFDAVPMHDFEQWIRENRGKNANDYVDAWVKQCTEKPTTIQVVHANNISNSLIERLPKANRFGIIIAINKFDLKLADKLIDLLRTHGTGKIVLENCAIRELDLRTTSRKVILKNCRVGLLRLDTESLSTFEMIGGSVRRTIAPAPYDKSPFTGSAEIRDVKLAPAFSNAQAYRNLRQHLTALHNHEAASVFHAAEMEAEVGRQSVVDKAISFFYRSLSNYGGSSARPLAICAALVMINFLLLLATDGVATLGEAREVDGWHYYL